MAYTPKNKITTGLFSSNNNFLVYEGSQIPYIGPYYKTSNGKFFTGVSPDSPPNLPITFPSNVEESFQPQTLQTQIAYGDFPTVFDSLDTMGYNQKEILDYVFLKNINLLRPTNKLLPPQYYPSPTDDSYEKGSINRFFCLKINQPIYTEISKETYDKLNDQDPNWYWGVYNTFFMPWTIVGEREEVYNVNRKITLLQERRLKQSNLSTFLNNNWLKFWKPPIISKEIFSKKTNNSPDIPEIFEVYIPNLNPPFDPSSFMFEVQVNNSSLDFTIPTTPGIDSSYNFIVNWGDSTTGTVTSHSDLSKTHTYDTEGTYIIRITGILRGLKFEGVADSLKVRKILNWGCLDIGIDGVNVFNGCSNMTVETNDFLSVDEATSLNSMFLNCFILNEFNGINGFNTVACLDMAYMFSGCKKFNQYIGDWNTSNVIDMSSMFYLCWEYNQYIGDWDVRKVKYMVSMFNNALIYNQSIENWITSALLSTSYMFINARKYNKPMDSWDMSKNLNISYMFYSAVDFNQNLNSWNTSEVVNMEGTFGITTKFNSLITNWITSKVNNMGGMFAGAAIFDIYIGGWDTAEVITMSNMFFAALEFNQDITLWNTIKVESMAYMFSNALKFNQDIGIWNTPALENTSFMFAFNIIFNYSLGNWIVTLLENAESMFTSNSLSTVNYNSTLVGWESQSVLKNVTFHGGSSTPSGKGITARASLRNDHFWTIVDGDG